MIILLYRCERVSTTANHKVYLLWSDIGRLSGGIVVEVERRALASSHNTYIRTTGRTAFYVCVRVNYCVQSCGLWELTGGLQMEVVATVSLINEIMLRLRFRQRLKE